MGPGAAPVTGAVNYSGSTATFTPAARLAPSTLYTATITTVATDTTGAPLAANYVWTFTTAPPPAVTSTVPPGGATNVPLNQKVAANFSTAMDPSTISAAGTFTLAATVGGAPYREPSPTRAAPPSSLRLRIWLRARSTPPQSRPPPKI